MRGRVLLSMREYMFAKEAFGKALAIVPMQEVNVPSTVASS